MRLAADGLAMWAVVGVLTISTVITMPLLAATWQSGDVPRQEDREAPEGHEDTVAKSKDPVCKLMVRRDPDLSVEHDGKVYYFCMRRDLEAFEKDPDKYLEGEDHGHPGPDLER